MLYKEQLAFATCGWN